MRLATIAIGLACAAATPAGVLAQSAVATNGLPVTGSSPQICSLSSASLRTTELVNFRGTDGDTLQVLQLVDPQTLAAQSARATVLIDGVCNFPHRIRIESQDNGLWPIEGPVSAPTNAFATALPYNVAFTWADRSGALQTDAKVRRTREVRADVDSPAAGDVKLEIELDAGASNAAVGAPVLAGNYGDTLRIFLEPR